MHSQFARVVNRSESFSQSMAVLQQLFGPTPMPVYAVSNGLTTIGRHEDCNIVVESPAVSRRHAEITFEDGRFYLEDLSSRNGTLLNGQPLNSRTTLNDGDQIEFSTLPYAFLTQNSLSELSGSWGPRANVIRRSQSIPDDDGSVRRQIMAVGDRITDEDLGLDQIRQEQIVSRIDVADSAGAWPVTNNPTQKLNHVLRLLHGFRRTTRRDDIIDHALQLLFDVFPSAERIAVVLRDDEGTGVHVAAVVTRGNEDDVEVCLPVVRASMQKSEALLYVDHWKEGVSDNPELNNASLRSILMAPLVGVGGVTFGAVQMDTTDRNAPLDKENLEELVVLNHVLSFVLERASMAAQAILERGTSDATRLRQHFEPAESPDVPGFRLANDCIAASDVATDLIDYVRLSDGKVACILVDVPDKGPEATALMALLGRLLTGAVSETHSAVQAIHDTERELRRRVDDIPADISTAVLILDPYKSSITVSLAGLCPLYLVHGNSVTQVVSEKIMGPTLGQDRESFSEAELMLSDDDMVLLFSDGIRQLTSPASELLQEGHLLEIIEDSASTHASVVESRLRRRLEDFRGHASLVDDVAFLMIHRSSAEDTVDGFGRSGDGSETRDR